MWQRQLLMSARHFCATCEHIIGYQIASHSGAIAAMTIQIAVRLADDIVNFVDRQVASDEAPSRAAVVTRALEHERRRQIAEQDAHIYASIQHSEFDGLAAWTATQPMDID